MGFKERFNLSKWALAHRQMVFFMLVVFTVSGIFAYAHLGQEEDPSYTVRAMVVQAYWPGADVRDMENQVTDRLAKALQTISEVDYVESKTHAGRTRLMIIVRDDVPAEAVADVWYDVRKTIGDMTWTLPPGVQGPFFDDDFGETFGNIYAITGDGFNYNQLEQFAKQLRSRVLQLPDVAEADLLGEQDQVIHIQMSNAKLATLGVPPQLILKTLSRTNSVVATGNIETRKRQVQIRVSGEFDSLDTIRKIGIHAGGHDFRLGDIARVSRDYADPPDYRMYYNGQPAVGVAISMLEGGNVIRLGKNLNRLTTAMQAGLPVGVAINTVSDQPRVVHDSISEFMQALLEAVAIVLIVSLISLGLRTGFVVVLCIPFVLALTFLTMYFVGIDLQRVSLGALIIALGLMVDDAIITVEMMSLKLEEGMSRVPAATFAYTSTAFPMLTGTLVTAAGFLPVILSQSSASEYAVSIFEVVVIALLLSWITAVVFTPYMGYYILKSRARTTVADSKQNVFDRPLFRIFRNCAGWCVDHRITVIVVTVILFGISLGLFHFVPKQFFPPSDRQELVVDLWLPPGATFAETQRQAQRFGDLIADNPDVVDYTTYVGGGSPRFYLPLDVQERHRNLAEIIVMTTDLEARERVFSQIRDLFDTDFAAVRGRVTRLALGPPVGYPVKFRVSGPDRQKTVALADRVAAIMRGNPNLRDVNSDQAVHVPTLHVQVNQDKARRLGVTSRDIAETLAASLDGITATRFREGDASIDVVGRLIKAERTDIDNIGSLLIHLPSGDFVPLSTLATMHAGNEPDVLHRRNRMPTVKVRADMATDAQPNNVTLALWPQLQTLTDDLPSTYDIAIGGSLEASRTNQAAIGATLPVVAIVVMFLLMWQLQDIRKMILVLLTAPLGMIGVSAIMVIFRIPFGFVAMLGVIALSGMIIRNAVILIDQIDTALDEGHAMREAIIEAAVHRFRPIMLTAACAVLAMIPLTTSTFWAPMAWAIMGGLLGATVLTLLFLPALYALCYRARRGEPRPEAES